MVPRETIVDFLESQKGIRPWNIPGIRRDELDKLKQNHSSGLFVLGVRGAGKSSFLKQFLSEKFQNPVLLNMEDPRLSGFELADLQQLDNMLFERAGESLAIDEIQLIENWESYIQSSAEESRNIMVAASNASLLDGNIWRGVPCNYLVQEIFPFSYREFLKTSESEPSSATMEEYIQTGGFPEYVLNRNEEILFRLLDDVVYKDIVVRRSIKQHKILRQLAIHMIGNYGMHYSLNKLKDQFGISSVRSVADYISYLEQSYLIFSVPKFSYSLKKQIANPRKVYSVDTGLAKVVSTSQNQTLGGMMENMVHLQLRRSRNKIYYYSEQFECDFVVLREDKPLSAIQVCHQLNQENFVKEIKGLESAMNDLNLDEGIIVTLDQEEVFERKDKQIRAIPIWKYLMEEVPYKATA